MQVPAFRDSSVLAITAAGFAATVAQILLLRELLVLFYGNEMSMALVLAGWLLWTALGSALTARWLRQVTSGASRFCHQTLASLLVLQALGLPALILAARAARPLLDIPAGELAPLGMMVLVCLATPALFAPVAGALFTCCWSCRWLVSDEGRRDRPLAIYLGEASGSALGGIGFYFGLLQLVTVWTAALITAGVLLVVSLRVSRGRRPLRSIMVITLLLLAGSVLQIDTLSRRWQWGPGVVAVEDTPFQNIAVLEQQEQVTVFTNGLWLLTEPDPTSAELAVHPALLQHAEPKNVLLLGGGLAGEIEEVLKHPDIERVDYVEQDPALVELVGRFLDEDSRSSLRDPRVRILRQDAGTYLRRSGASYDAILMSVGDPINAQMNRFYTVEHFERLRRRLRPGGLVSFSVPGGGDMIGPSHARLLGSLDKTLRQVFPAVVVLPGHRARFLAAQEATSLVLDPAILAARIEERNLRLVFLHRDTLEDLMGPDRLDYALAILDELESSPVNRQFEPICYLFGMMLWAAQWHPTLISWLETGTAISRPQLLLAASAVAGLVALCLWLGRPRYRLAVAASVFVQGASAMVLQVVLILVFQIMAGFAYLQLALIIAFFMAGLALGAFRVAARRRAWGRDSPARQRLLGIQAGVTLLPLGLIALVTPITESLREGLPPIAVSVLFTLLSLFSGLLAGSHFSLAVLAATAAGARLERTGGYFYAIDLAGAAAGAVAAGLFLLPVYGVASTLALLALSSLVCLVALLRGRQMPGMA